MLGFLIGCLISAMSGWFVCLHVSVIILLVPLIIIIFIFPSRFILVLALIIGFFLAEIRITPALSARIQWRQLFNQELILTGVLAEDPALGSGQISLRLTQVRLAAPVENPVENFTEEGTSDWLALSGTLYVLIPESSSLTYASFMRSDTITISGVVKAGFGTFVAAVYRPEIVAWTRASPGDLAAHFKSWFASLVQQYIPRPSSELGLSYLLGYKAGLSESLNETLRIVGMTHVVVASGSHLGILVHIVRKLFGRLSKFADLFFSLLLIGAFLLVVGFTPSMLRAVLVTALSLIFGYCGRRFAPWRILMLAATFTLVLDPLNCLSLSWQLSFASFTGILLLAPRLQTFFYGAKQPSWLAASLLTSIATLALCAPLLIYTFGSISLLSLVANLVILPTLPICMLLVFTTGLTSFFPPLAALIGQLAHLLLTFHIQFLTFLSQFSSFSISFPATDPRIFLIYLGVIPALLPATLWTHLGHFLKKCYNKRYEGSLRIRDG